MAQRVAAQSELTIERLRTVYILSREHPDPEQLRARLDELMRTLLPDMCAALLTPVFDAGDPSIWLIRRLEVQLAVDPTLLAPERVAHAWVRSIATTLACGPDGENVLRFPDEAAYLARFVAELAEGSAWGRWYYKPFAALRSLPVSAAIREALTRRPEQAERALRALASDRWLDTVLHALSPADAMHIYSALAPETAETHEVSRTALDMLLDLWPRTFARIALPNGASGAPAHDALRLYLAARLRSPQLSAADVHAAIALLFSIAHLLRQVPAAAPLRQCLAHGDLSGAIDLAHAIGIGDQREWRKWFEALERAAGGDAAWLAHVARTVMPSAEHKAPSPQATAFATPCAGLFLLLPSMVALDLPRFIGEAPYAASARVTASVVLRALLALKCLGRPRGLLASYDPALPLALGLDALPPPDLVRQVAGTATTQDDIWCVERLVERLIELGRATGRWLYADLASLCADVGRDGDRDGHGDVVVLRDLEGGAWLWARDAASAPVALRQGLLAIQTAAKRQAEYLLIGPYLASRLDHDDLAGLARRVIWPEEAALSPSQGQPEGQDRAAPAGHSTESLAGLPEALRAANAHYIGRATPLATELAYFSLPDALAAVCARSFDLTWTVVARAALRDFAAHLIGFATSSPEYLFANFLAGTGTVRVEGDHITVELPASPLQIVLRMSSVADRTYAHPWLSETQVTLSLGTD